MSDVGDGMAGFDAELRAAVGARMAAGDGWGFSAEDERVLADITAQARLAGIIPGTMRFARSILAAGYRRVAAPSPLWEFEEPEGRRGT